MRRRSALKLLGAVLVCMVGKPVRATETDLVAIDDTNVFQDWMSGPMSYEFSEATTDKIIINRTNGKRIEIPFSEICDALEGSE